MKNSYKLKLFVAAFTFWLIPATVFGVDLSFEPASVDSNQAKTYAATLLISTDGESVNAVDGTLLVNEALGSDITVSDSGSIVTYWVTRPSWDPATRTIKFSGTIPGGYEGQSGILFSVILPPRTGGSIDNAVVVGETNAYLNDGLGTQARVTKSVFSLSSSGAAPVDPEISSQLYVDPNRQDNIPPEEFSPQLAQDDRVYGGKWFINFATTDKESGISHYEIQETRSGRLNSGRWRTAESPYLLEDQELHSFIYVVAVDRRGNERMIKVFPRKPLTFWQRYNTDMAIGAAILGVLLAAGMYTKRKTKPKSHPKV